MPHRSGSSGDLAADRRFDMAQLFIEQGNFEAAADLMRQALDLTPAWPEGQFTLGETLMRAGHADTAITVLQSYLALDPSDSMGAHPKLAQLGAIPATTELPPAYVERLFDQYAPRFETALVERLKYSAPQSIRHALATHFGQRRFLRALDLGCGTGLMGTVLRDLVDHLEGIDLSARMLAEAKRKKIYDALTQTDVLRALNTSHPYDLIVAADVFVYMGDLAPVAHATHTALAAGGVFIFTVQKLADDGYRLGADHRFSHSENYVKTVMAAFELISIVPGTLRREANTDVSGFLVIAEKRC